MVLENIHESELWEHFLKNKEALLSHEDLVCQNNDIGVSIYVTAEYPLLYGDGILMKLILAEDQEEVDSRICESRKEVKKVYEEFYEFVSGKPIYADASDEEEEDEFIRSRIEEQETALDDAVYTFLDVASNGSAINLTDEELADIKDHFCEYIARKHGVDVFRPMFLENEEGVDEYYDYPYEDMEFEDEDNPIYQKGVSA